MPDWIVGLSALLILLLFVYFVSRVALRIIFSLARSIRRILKYRLSTQLFMHKSYIVGWHVSILGWILVVWGFLLIRDNKGIIFPANFGNEIQILASIALWLIGVRALIFGRKLKAIAAHILLSKDHRQPIVYLRSFSDEGKWKDYGMGWMGWIRMAGTLRIPTTYEQLLARAFRDIGPVVAIGKPGEQLPELGATRLYLDTNWQDTVKSLLAKAQLVIFRAGMTEGFWWEVDAAAKVVKPERLLFFMPFEVNKKGPSREELYQRFKSRLEQQLPRKLPEVIGNAIFLCFSQDWTPHLLHPVRTDFLALYRTKIPGIKSNISIELTLRPLLKKLYPNLPDQWV